MHKSTTDIDSGFWPNKKKSTFSKSMIAIGGVARDKHTRNYAPAL